VTRANICYLDAEAGKLAEARACQESVVAALEKALGPVHPQVAWALNDVALIQQQQGDRDGARARFERALAIWERASGREHPDVAWPLINLADLAIARGDHAAAEAMCTRALAVAPGEHAVAAHAQACLGSAMLGRSPAEATRLLRLALEMFGAQEPNSVARVEFALARALDASKARDEALVHARRARERLNGPERDEVDAWLRARAAAVDR
jgi:serine/threonine-protein kinase